MEGRGLGVRECENWFGWFYRYGQTEGPSGTFVEVRCFSDRTAHRDCLHVTYASHRWPTTRVTRMGQSDKDP